MAKSSGYVTDLPLACVAIEGKDSNKYLQGQLSQDMNLISPQQAVRACHCDAKGKLWTHYLLVQWQQTLYAITYQTSLDVSLPELKKYAVFSDIKFSHEDDLVLTHMQGQSARTWLAARFDSLPEQPMQASCSDSGVVVRLEGAEEAFLLLSQVELQQALNDSELTPLPQSVWRQQQIATGIAHVGAVNSQEFVPQMLNLHALNMISFTKGCYIGQETVARTKYLGKNKRAAFILHTDSDTPLDEGELLESQVGENWRRGGTLINYVTLDNTSWGIAVLPNDTEIGSILRSKSHPEVVFRVQPLPYTLDDE